MTSTQNANDWDSLSPAEQFDQLSHPSNRKLYLLVFQALRHDFAYLWLSPEYLTDSDGHVPLPPLREAIEVSEHFADRELDQATTREAVEVWQLIKEAAVMA